MNRIKLYIVLVIVLLLVNTVLVVFCLNNGPGNKRPPQPREVVIRRLNLDASQIEAYEELIRWHRSHADEQLSVIQGYKRRLYTSLSERNDSVLVNALTDSVALAHRKLEQIHYRHFSDIRRLCRPDQHDAFNELSKDLARLFQGNGRPPR